MKKIYIFLFLCCTFVGVHAQYNINFDSFTLGDVSAQSPHLIMWPAATATDPQVTDVQAYSAPHSMLVRAQAGTVEDDIIFQLGDRTVGTWVVEYWMYVPTGNNGYFNLQQNEAGLPTQWNGEYFVDQSSNGGATGVVTQKPSMATVPYPNDTWFQVVVTVDLDLGEISVMVDGAYLLQNTVYEDTDNIPATQLGGMDFYSADASTTFYIDDFNFYRTCYAPENKVLDAVTDTTADISWDASNETDGYNWVVMADGDDPVVGTPVNSGTVATGLTGVTVTGLTYLTDYDFYILSDCGAEGLSNYGNALDFTTGAQCTVSGAVTSFPYTEDFETNSPTLGCWTQIQEVGAADWIYAEGSTAGAVVTAHSGTQNARYVSLNEVGSPVTKLVSPVFDLTTTTNPEVTFYYAQEDWFGAYNELKLYYRGAPTDAWVELAHYGSSANAWTQASVLLPNPTATYQIAFEGINNFGHANVIDDVVVQDHLSVHSPVFERFAFYPNPVEKELTLEALKPMENVEVYNLLGEKLISKRPNEARLTLGMESLQPGVYFMKVHIDGTTKVFKLLKQ